MKNKVDFKWIIKIVVCAVVMSAVFTLASSEVLESAGYLVAFLVLVIFIALGLLFDAVGVAVTYAQEKPFHSMASHKERGAKEAIALVKNAEKVGSFCNDVVGDISGIVSGTTGAVIVSRLVNDFSFSSVVTQVVISAVVAGVTIGGKAIGKTFAVKSYVKIVLSTAKMINFFSRIFGKDKRK